MPSGLVVCPSRLPRTSRCLAPTQDGQGRRGGRVPVDLLLDVVEKRRMTAGRYADLILVLALTGVRFGELRGLRVRDVVAVPYPGLVVKRSIPQSGRTVAVIERSTTKSGRTRLVPLTERVRPIVNAWAKDREPDDLLFPAPEGGYLHAENRRPAVRWTTTGLRRRSHDLSHRAASIGISPGVDIKTVSSWLGHSTAKLTLDTYRHLMSTDADRAALARVNRAVARHGYGSAWGTDCGGGGRDRKCRATSGNVLVPPARFELATPALGVRPGSPWRSELPVPQWISCCSM